MKIYSLALSLLLSGCHLPVLPDSSEEPVYKFNPLEMREELTYPDSELRYNIYSREWVFVK